MMNKQSLVWKFIFASFEKNIPVMLLYVLESSGSSPGRQGFFMAVNANKEMEGSIGGGIMEHKFVEMAKEKLAVDSWQLAEGEIRKQIHDKSAAKNQSGMICSGEQTIFLYRVDEKDISHIKNLIS
ncbi:MAG: XdhC family protein, partial [Bacteroidota bacterium]|nr:XdhC family protein [Bacteroidota bacterium]